MRLFLVTDLLEAFFGTNLFHTLKNAVLVWARAETSDGPGNRQWGTSLSLDFKISQLAKNIKNKIKKKARAGSEGNCHRWIWWVWRDLPNTPHRQNLKPLKSFKSSALFYDIQYLWLNKHQSVKVWRRTTSYVLFVSSSTLRNPVNSFIRTVWVQCDWHQLTTWASSCHQVSIEMLLNPDWCMGVHEIPFSHLTPPTLNQ